MPKKSCPSLYSKSRYYIKWVKAFWTGGTYPRLMCKLWWHFLSYLFFHFYSMDPDPRKQKNEKWKLALHSDYISPSNVFGGLIISPCASLFLFVFSFFPLFFLKKNPLFVITEFFSLTQYSIEYLPQIIKYSYSCLTVLKK